MYRIIGADGKEYGPVSADLIRQWIAQSRANANTKIRSETSAEWKLLSQMPEFAADLAAPTAAPPPPAAALVTPSQALVNELLARDYQLEIGKCISRGWELVMKHFWLTFGATLLIHIIVAALSPTIIGLALTYVFVGGLEWMFLKLARGQKAELGDAFAGFSLAFGSLALFSLIGQLLTVLGLVFCLIPGIYLGICWLFFTALLIVDKKLDFWPAMELSRKMVTRHWWQVFGFALVCLLLMICGTLLCGIGVFLAMPIVKAATVYAYEDIFGARTAVPPSAPATT